MGQENVNIVRRAYEAFGRGDIAAVLAVMDPKVEWIEAEGFAYPGTYIGPDAVRNGVFLKLGTEWDHYRAVADEILDAGDTVVALGTYSGTYKATGKSFRAKFAHVWRLRNGKAVKFQQYTDTAKVQGALSG